MGCFPSYQCRFEQCRMISSFFLSKFFLENKVILENHFWTSLLLNDQDFLFHLTAWSVKYDYIQHNNRSIQIKTQHNWFFKTKTNQKFQTAITISSSMKVKLFQNVHILIRCNWYVNFCKVECIFDVYKSPIHDFVLNKIVIGYKQALNNCFFAFVWSFYI